MSVSVLSRSELIAAVLAEIRKCDGCEGVDSIAIQETRVPRSATNWEISIIAASRGDPVAVQRAAAAVQQSLQQHYRLSDGRAHPFKAGDRVRLSATGQPHAPEMQAITGTVSLEKSRTREDSISVLFDGARKPMRLHHTHIELIGPGRAPESA